MEEAVGEDVRLLLPLIAVMTNVRLTSLLPDVPPLLSPKPGLNHGKRNALFSLLNITLNLCILSFVLLLVFLSHLRLATSPTVLPGSPLWSLSTT